MTASRLFRLLTAPKRRTDAFIDRLARKGDGKALNLIFDVMSYVEAESAELTPIEVQFIGDDYDLYLWNLVREGLYLYSHAEQSADSEPERDGFQVILQG